MPAAGAMSTGPMISSSRPLAAWIGRYSSTIERLTLRAMPNPATSPATAPQTPMRSRTNAIVWASSWL